MLVIPIKFTDRNKCKLDFQQMLFEWTIVLKILKICNEMKRIKKKTLEENTFWNHYTYSILPPNL